MAHARPYVPTPPHMYPPHPPHPPPDYSPHSSQPPDANFPMPPHSQPPPQPPHLHLPPQPHSQPLHTSMSMSQPSHSPTPPHFTRYPTPMPPHDMYGQPPSPYTYAAPYGPPGPRPLHEPPPPGSQGPFLPPGAMAQTMSNGPASPYTEAAATPPPPMPSQSTAGGPFIPHSPATYGGPPGLTHHPSIIQDPRPSYFSAPYYNASATPTPQKLLQTAEVRLEISCKGLRDRDLTSKSDPTCVVFLEDRFSGGIPGYPPSYAHALEPADQDGVDDASSSSGAYVRGMKWREVGRTECIKNNLNPHFKQQVAVPYRFEELQHVRLGLWDIDSKKSELRWHDFLGDVRTTLGELVAARVWTAKLTSPSKRDMKGWLGTKRDLGTITVIVHENQDGGDLLIKASLSGKKLPRMDLGFSSDPYFIVQQVGTTEASSGSQLYRSEVIKRNTNPSWKPCQFQAVIPKGGDQSHVTLKFVVYDKDKWKRDDPIGEAQITVKDMEQKTSVPLIDESKKMKKGRYKDRGTLEFNTFVAIKMPSLVDYLQGGLKLHFTVAVDLTGSNGPPSNPRSLHYRADMYSGNDYIHALNAVADVLRVYTPSDNMFAAYGFGAELPGHPGITSSCFPLGLGPSPYCYGISGILHAYSTALGSVTLSGPTNFAPLIEQVSQTSASRPNTQADQNYDVLLILTDGALSDFNRTVDRIITASRRVALSIIIIGIGKRDFSKMKDLDCDGKLLTSQDGNHQAARDICQFVEFNEFRNAPPERLGAAVLQELPGNIVEYFVGQCEPPIMPGQRQVASSINY